MSCLCAGSGVTRQGSALASCTCVLAMATVPTLSYGHSPFLDEKIIFAFGQVKLNPFTFI